MAKFDISLGNGATNIGGPDVAQEANNEPAPLQPCLRSDSIRMRAKGAVLVTKHLGTPRPGGWAFMSLLLLVFCTKLAHADPGFSETAPTRIDPDPPARTPLVAPALPPSNNLDGLYVWLGPSGAASRIDAEWDSTIGGDISIIRVRENDLLGAIGGSFGAQRWTVRGGGRLWLDALIGTKLGRMIGLSAGPILELNELAHPRVGGSIGAWGFVGVAPYVRAGAVTDLGGFVEVGVHIALPVLRRR
jgi:hypothetical protein